MRSTDEYVGATGHEANMLFGSGKIPGVKSFCQLLNPIERAPFASNVRPPVTNKDLFRMDLELQVQVRLSSSSILTLVFLINIFFN